MSNFQTVLSSLNLRSAQQGDEKIVNRAGGEGYRRSKKEQVVQILTTGTLSDTYYASKQELAEEAFEVLGAMRDSDPMFLARACVYAREQGLMRSLPVLGLALLAGGRSAAARTALRGAFPRVIAIPDDLRDFVSAVTSGAILGRKGLGGVVRDLVRGWVGNISEYHALKYGSAASKGVTLRDIVRMTHPAPSDATICERLGWLVAGKAKLGDNPALNPQLRAFEALKRESDVEAQCRLIESGHLPFEVVLPAVRGTDLRVWSAVFRNAPYGNLLRNLVSFTRHGVFESEANVAACVERLTAPEAVARSRVLPYQFFSAHEKYVACEGSLSSICDALRVALNLSFVNLPSLGKRRVAIGTDVSGSMSGNVSKKSTARFIDIAGIFTGALLKKAEGLVFPLPFEDQVRKCDLSGRDDIMVTTDKLARLGGGGTAVGAPVQHLLDRKIQVDVFIGITDNEDWANGDGWSTRKGFLELWKEYVGKVAPSAKAYLLTIAPYRDAVAPTSSGVRFIYGWSDSVPKYIALDLEGGSRQIQEIESMKLGSVGE